MSQVIDKIDSMLKDAPTEILIDALGAIEPCLASWFTQNRVIFWTPRLVSLVGLSHTQVSKQRQQLEL